MERFIRMSSPSVATQVHVSPDSRYILLPVMERATRIRGWVVYDSTAGFVVEADQTFDPNDAGIFESMHAAREWVLSTRLRAS